MMGWWWRLRTDFTWLEIGLGFTAAVATMAAAIHYGLGWFIDGVNSAAFCLPADGDTPAESIAVCWREWASPVATAAAAFVGAGTLIALLRQIQFNAAQVAEQKRQGEFLADELVLLREQHDRTLVEKGRAELAILAVEHERLNDRFSELGRAIWAAYETSREWRSRGIALNQAAFAWAKAIEVFRNSNE